MSFADKKPSVIGKTAFVMYPINKQDKYSNYENSPEIVFEFAQNMQRHLKSNTLRLAGRCRILNINDGNGALPANRFDAGTGETSKTVADYEKVCYFNERIGINSVINNMIITTLDGSVLETVKDYNRTVANIIPARNSYEDLCSYNGTLLTAAPNNDMAGREASGEVEHALPFMNGMFVSNDLISLERGLAIKIDLAPDAKVLFGASASDFVYELYDLNIFGDYIEFDVPAKLGSQDYASYKTFNNVIQSSNTHNNVPLNLSEVSNIFQSYIPSEWTNNTSYDSFSLCKPMNRGSQNKPYEEAGNGISIITFNRGNVRYPNKYEIDERTVNGQKDKNDNFQAVRSRHYLNSIAPYYNNENIMISPETEQIKYMVTPRTDPLKTPQACDGGLLKKWGKNDNGVWEREGPTESSKYIYGYGVNLDALSVRSYSNYANSTFNYSLTTNLDNTSTQVYTFATSFTALETNSSGMIISVS